jgi:hypothetical protein
MIERPSECKFVHWITSNFCKVNIRNGSQHLWARQDAHKPNVFEITFKDHDFRFLGKNLHIHSVCISDHRSLLFLAFCHGLFFSVHRSTRIIRGTRWKSEGRGFDCQWCHWNFSLTQFFRPHYGPGFDSNSNRNEYQEYFLGGNGGWCLGLTTLTPSYFDFLELCESQHSGNLSACPDPYRVSTFTQ